MKKGKVKKFNSKKEVIGYIIKSFKKDAKIITIHGSTSIKPIEQFSDIDVEVFSKKDKKPYYEIIFVKNKVVLITVYYEKYIEGKKIRPPKGVKVIYGDYNDKIWLDFKKKKYKLKDKTIRECQLVTDFLFTYFRKGDKKYLGYVQKRLMWD